MLVFSLCSLANGDSPPSTFAGAVAHFFIPFVPLEEKVMQVQSSFARLHKSFFLLRGRFHLNAAANAPEFNSKSKSDWRCVVGLEIHAQLSTNTKLFSNASSIYGAPTNSVVQLFDAAVPGTLPTLNKEAVKLAVISALALRCNINPLSCFERKHYFYSDLPAGFQITQQKIPLAENGLVNFAVYQPDVHKQPYYKTCKIKQIQLEQDSGKSLHEGTKKQSYIDLNRAGTSLIEIVFQPKAMDGEEVCALVKEVIQILERAGSCSCKLEEGALRIDANVSVNKEGEELGIRTEIKNIGSVHGVSSAVKYEFKRQTNLLRNKIKVKNETLTWDSVLNKVVVMRDKGEKHDYRFMPEPNLLPLRLIVDENSEKIYKDFKFRESVLDVRYLKEKIPDSPHDERIFLREKYGLCDVYAYNLVGQYELLIYFKKILKENPLRNPNITYFLLMYHLLNALKLKNLKLSDCSVSEQNLGQIVDLLQANKISKIIGNNLLKEILSPSNNLSPIEMVEKFNLGIISDPEELRVLCLKIIKEKNIKIYQKQKKQKAVFNELMTKAIEESKFRADTKVLSQIMSELLADLKK